MLDAGKILRPLHYFMQLTGSTILRIALSTAVIAWLFCAGSAQALTLLPPLPSECVAANRSENADDKVRFYTLCLKGSGIDFNTGVKMQDWQRHEIHFKRGNALFQLQRYPEALADYEHFIAKAGGHVWAFHQRGLTYLAMSQLQNALSDFNEALKRNPDAIAVRYDRGLLHEKLGNYRLAIADLRKAASLSPETALFANDLAWLLATCPEPHVRNGAEAVNYARSAVNLEKSASYLDTLAASLARNGEFEEAAETQQRAIRMLKENKAEKNVISAFENRLGMYLARQAYTQKKPR